MVIAASVVPSCAASPVSRNKTSQIGVLSASCRSGPTSSSRMPWSLRGSPLSPPCADFLRPAYAKPLSTFTGKLYRRASPVPSYHERREWWNSERAATLTDLACSTAARHIADILGTTRNAVLGKAHRLGLTLRRDNQGEGDRRHYSPERRRERFLRNRELELARNRARYARQQLEHGHVVQP